LRRVDGRVASRLESRLDCRVAATLRHTNPPYNLVV